MAEHGVEPLNSAFSDQKPPLARGPSSLGPRENRQSDEARELTSLLDVSKSLAGASRLKTRVHHVLEILERHHGAVRSAVTLLSEGSHELYIEASVGLSSGGRLVRYRIGEGGDGPRGGDG
jgi:Nif-specific regulatory protein